MLTVENLSVTFSMYNDGLRQQQLVVITDLDLEINAGEVVAVLGSSGSGKSLLAHAVLGILPNNASVGGTMMFAGEPLTTQRQAQLRGKQIALIPQSVGYLDPLMPVGQQVARAAQLSGVPQPQQAVRQTFNRYSLADRVRNMLPFQLSGGMARRILVSTAAIGQAQLIIADEPTPGLHPDVVAETLRHLRELADSGKAVMLITHDIQAALAVADRVAVFYAGTTVEVARATDFAGDGQALRHPYTQALWRALPQNDFTPLPGVQPAPNALPSGCLFLDRCPLKTSMCEVERPALRSLRGGAVRCIHAT